MDKAFKEIVKSSTEVLESVKEGFDPEKFKNYYEKMLELTLPFAEKNKFAKALSDLAKAELEIINEDQEK